MRGRGRGGGAGEGGRGGGGRFVANVAELKPDTNQPTRLVRIDPVSFMVLTKTKNSFKF